MSKKIISLIIVILVASVLFAGCESYKMNTLSEVSDPNAVVTSNSGLAVKQGEYIYFINGKSDYAYTESSENYFNHKNNQLKGAILRGKLSDNGSIENVVTVVPKNVMTSYTSGGFYIYGDWIYYTSPTTTADFSGNMKSDSALVFYRTKTDGSKTQKICEVEGTTFEYVVTPECILYTSANSLYRVDLTANRNFKSEQIVETYSAIRFFVNPSFNPATSAYNAVAVYTKSSDDESAMTNELYYVNAQGESKLLINQNTFTDDPLNVNNITKVYNVTVTNAFVANDKAIIYYTLAYTRGGTSTVAGSYSYVIDGQAFDEAKQKQIHHATISTTAPIDESSYYYLDTNIYKLYKDGVETEIIDFGATVTVMSIENVAGKDYIYYLSSSALHRREISLTGEEVKSNAQVIKATSQIATDWLSSEYLSGYIFYTNSANNNYTYALKLDTYNVLDSEMLVDTLIGFKTKADLAAEEE